MRSEDVEAAHVGRDAGAPRMDPFEQLIYYGGAAKALDDKGKVGGYLVLYGSPDATDASPLRDYFTPETDFDLDAVGGKSRLLYHHGLDRKIGNRKIGLGNANLKADDVGIWLESQLNLRDAYEAKMFQMVQDKKLGLSSGTVNHLIRREKQSNGSNKILAWPLGLDASLTPAPAEPRTQAVALKSLLLDAAKGDFLGELSEPAAAMAAVRSLGEMLCCSLWKSLGDEAIAPADRMLRIGGAFDEFKSTCLKMIMPLLIDAAAEDAGAAKAHALEDLRLLDQLAELDARLIGAI
jgi:hypothetical protein